MIFNVLRVRIRFLAHWVGGGGGGEGDKKSC